MVAEGWPGGQPGRRTLVYASVYYSSAHAYSKQPRGPVAHLKQEIGQLRMCTRELLKHVFKSTSKLISTPYRTHDAKEPPLR